MFFETETGKIPNMENATRRLTLKEVAARHQVCVKTVRNWIGRGLDQVRLKGHLRHGNRIVVDPADLESFWRRVEKRRFGQ